MGRDSRSIGPGQSLWTSDERFVAAIGDVDRDGRADLALAESIRESEDLEFPPRNLFSDAPSRLFVLSGAELTHPR